MQQRQVRSKKHLLANLIANLERDYRKLPMVSKMSDIVPPEGNPDAQIMFIGEAAGYHEHVQRRPFVGAAGNLLTKSLEDIALTREKVWISNLVKARPPENRDPLPEEIEAYKPYLDQEIQIVKPKLIVTLGRYSLAKFIPNLYISKIHGQARWLDWHNERILVFPMYHPAAALRNQSILKLFKMDFAKLAQVIQILNKQSDVKSDARVKKEANKKESKIDKDGQLQLI